MPTQIGSTLSPPWSFRITMGMLVTGSIISPRIFISTSIMLPPGACPFILPMQYAAQPVSGWLDNHIAQQAVGKCLRDPYVYVVSDAGLRLTVDHEIKRLVLRGAADHLSTGRVLPFHHHLKRLAQMPAVACPLDLSLVLLQDLQAARFLGVRNRIGVLERRRVRTRRVLKREDAVVTYLVEET